MSHTLSRGSRKLQLGDTGGYTPSREVQLWVQRILQYTSSAPSLVTQAAMDAFLTELDVAGIRKKIVVANCFVPDGISASATPIIRGAGYDVWKAYNYVNTDLTIHGIKGNAVNKYLDTGINLKGTFGSASMHGITIYCSHYNNTNAQSTTHMDCLVADGVGQNQSSLLFGYNGYLHYDAYNYLSSNASVRHPYFRGYISANYSSSKYPDSHSIKIYKGNSQCGHSLLYSSQSFTPNPTIPNNTVYLAASSGGGGTVGNYTSRSYSFMALHTPLTVTESLALYTAVENMRAALGGGRVNPDPVQDWVERVIYNGGAAPSEATQNALRTFYNGLVSNNLLSKMKVINAVVPDNLSASLTPFWNSTGSYDPWINSGFTSAQLSVNGLTGSGTAYLNTGFVPSLSYTTSSDGGLTLYIYNSTSQYPECEFGVHTGATGNQAMCFYAGFQNVTYADMYSQNYGRISGANAGYRGYISANHGENLGNGIIFAIYTGSSTTGHGIFTSSLTVQGGTLPSNQLVAMANNMNNSIVQHSRKGVSFFAIHKGLTISESANFYTLVQQLRTDLGGGYV